ncbi:MAG: hypothetical protein ACEY26_00685 [Candidatus Hodgkinia cicadicola]
MNTSKVSKLVKLNPKGDKANVKLYKWHITPLSGIPREILRTLKLLKLWEKVREWERKVYKTKAKEGKSLNTKWRKVETDETSFGENLRKLNVVESLSFTS